MSALALLLLSFLFYLSSACFPYSRDCVQNNVILISDTEMRRPIHRRIHVQTHRISHYTPGSVEPITRETRDVIARLANCVRLLVDNSISLSDTSLIHAYNASSQYQTKDLIRPEIADEVAAEALRRLRSEE